MFSHFSTLIGVISLGAGVLYAHPQQPFIITDNVDLVLLDVSVKHSQASYVTNLPRESFQVKVDGRSQPISHFAHVDAPVSIGLVVDNSGSMRRKRDHVITAGLSFAGESNPLDEFFVVNFNDAVTFGLPTSTLFTDRLELLRQALYMGEAQGRTALYDAIAAGLKRLENAHREQRTLIVVSDGGDNVSQLHQRDILQLVEESRATMYAIGLLDPDDHDLQPAFLKKLALISGGEYLQPERLDDIPAVLKNISRDIRSRYSVGFAPPLEAQPGKLHHLKVIAIDSAGNKLVVRTRTTYSSHSAEHAMATSLRSGH